MFVVITNFFSVFLYMLCTKINFFMHVDTRNIDEGSRGNRTLFIREGEGRERV